MKIYQVIIAASLLFLSCNNKSEISKDFNCKTAAFPNLEEIVDVKKLFSVQFPKTWKTQLYYDAVQSSIFTADTTKQLTETMLLDITFINKKSIFDTTFKLKEEQESLSKKLIQTKTKETKLLKKPAFYTLSKGLKGKFTYQVCKAFIKINEENFILAKVEVYGDSLVNQRLCNAFTLIDKIKIID
ncbi:hypothetical protein [Polaribacter sp.]|uniref:hypothetical protein n=1 Tax=Polaribacter sp. TaxID=1920175 RepID=UPI003EF95C62